MKFKIDENLPVEFADLLRKAGHDADTVNDEGLVGAPDENVIAACEKESRCLITLDLDFSDMRAYPPEDLNGLVVLRLRQQDKAHVLEIASRVIPLLEIEPLEKRLWIVDEERVRIRGGE